MLDMLKAFMKWLFTPRPKITIRRWDIDDIRALATIEQEDGGPITGETFFDWILEEQVYGVVAVENGAVAGFAVAYPDSGYIYTLRVKKTCRRRKIGTRILKHLLVALSVWERQRLSIDVSDRNVEGRRFLERNSFAVVLITEYHDEEKKLQEAFLTLQRPPPFGFTWNDVMVVNGDETIEL